ncbi:hypothetical protein D6C86_10378 [Aureobasidium pullulans]|uniref:Uncharacterized protein n=1 Tax=Aureobasidium pullulans TaxID=5580 RepID=A0A4S9YHX2_AURPU|nr:hypothetical protein D6C94_08965 [Aureobasidium pullulans]THZ35429.1 hypothetical protein D6C87_09821 [Aureobasidium pullulans]THZ51862.1 hypothetical protein D6C86_10378 [Aureobasidium pullulans]THZ93118.1 hypothetical protein D6C88_02861 [Aureobasidium pullulans]
MSTDEKNTRGPAGSNGAQKQKDPTSSNNKPTKDQQGDVPSKEEVNKESSKAAKKALELQKHSKELTQAAADAGDPEERQRLLDEALAKSKEAESLGKTAKFLSSGGFQGLLAGGGVGSIIGVGLGTLVGTLTGALVGGVGTLVVGGLGSGIGSAVGALHGPWLKSEEALRDGLGKITGALPNWTATSEQKEQLEKIMGQIEKQDTPTDEELKAMTGGDT